MASWKAELLKIAQVLLGNPQSTVELAVTAFLGVVACIIALNILSKLFKYPMTDLTRVATIVLAGLTLAILVVAAINIYVAPKIASEGLCRMLPFIAAGIVILGCVAPFSCYLNKIKYTHSLMSIVLTLAAAAIVISMTQGAFGALRSGNKDMNKAKNRNKALQETIGH